jgi:hypothetical protein
MGIIDIKPLQTTFVLEIDPDKIGDYLDGNHYSTRKYKNSEGKQLTKRIGWYEQIMSDEVWDLAYGVDWGEDWKSALDNYVDSNNEKLIESMINEWISKSGDEVDEDMDLEDKLEQYDDNYDIRNAISGAENDVASGEYVNYLQETLKDALNEYGNVFEFSTENIKIQMDLKDYINNIDQDIIEEYYENCDENPRCVFEELLGREYIDKPKPSFYNYWSPDIDKTEYNQLLRQRLNEI